MAREEPPLRSSISERQMGPVRALLEQTAEREESPERNLVTGAVRRLRARRTAVVHVNEFLGLLVALMRGWTTLLAIEESPMGPPRPRANRKDEGDFS